jgi:ribosomal-protein-alanine N-acetyltransferase
MIDSIGGNKVLTNFIEILYDNETLITPSLMLRKFKKEDAVDILEFGSDAKTLEYLIWDGVQTIEDAQTAIFEYYWSKPGIYAIELQATQKCIGCIDLHLKPEHEKAGFGYVLNRAYWGKGYMTEALSVMLALCFEKLELNRVEACHYVGNEGSGRVMAKCGMVLEGVGKQQVKIKGIFHDNVHYGITRERWLTLR